MLLQKRQSVLLEHGSALSLLQVHGLSTPFPPQTIISEPVHTAVWLKRPAGVLAPVLVGSQVSVDGL